MPMNDRYSPLQIHRETPKAIRQDCKHDHSRDLPASKMQEDTPKGERRKGGSVVTHRIGILGAKNWLPTAFQPS